MTAQIEVRDRMLFLHIPTYIKFTMSTIKQSSLVERVASSLLTEGALTAVAATIGTPLTALLPILNNSLAAGRQRQRVEATLIEMNEVLLRHEHELAALTDQQYKFINEAILSLLHTTNVEKMALLSNVVRNGLKAKYLPDQEAVFLSRIVRDISADEAAFLMKNFSYDRIWMNETEPRESASTTLAIKPATPEGHIVLGLMTLGLVTIAEPTWDESGLLRYTPLVAKLIALIQQNGG